MSISYTDGDKIETKILQLVNATSQIHSECFDTFNDTEEWAIKYHLCPERANLVRHLDFTDLDVLELGAGMGAISRYLSEKAKTLKVVEGTEQRYAVLQSRLRDRTNWSGTVANIQEVELKTKYDVVCLIGVLEYSELYINTTDSDPYSPFKAMISKAASFLKPDGVLLLAIENQLGVKYLSGAAEDHTGNVFDSICGYPLEKTPKTFSRKKLLSLLSQNGFAQIDEQFPFPDYKIPSVVLTQNLMEKYPELCADLATTHAFQNYGYPRRQYYPDVLAIKTFAEAGLLPDLANSFLFLATHNPSSPIRQKLLKQELEEEQWAWHYSSQRKIPTVTIFSHENDEGPITVHKQMRSLVTPSEINFRGPSHEFIWHCPQEETIVSGKQIRPLLANRAYYEKWDSFFNILESFLSWSFKRWSSPQQNSEEMSGSALDAVFLNAATSSSFDEVPPDFSLYDLEWKTKSPIPKSWFILRNVFGLARNKELFCSAPFPSFKELYENLCDSFDLSPHFDSDILREAEFQKIATQESSLEKHQEQLKSLFEAPFPESPFPRKPPARISVTLVHQLKGKTGALGLATLCVSGGQGASILVRAL